MIRHLLTALYVREALLGMALAVAGGGAAYGAGEGIWAIAASGTGATHERSPQAVSALPGGYPTIAGDN